LALRGGPVRGYSFLKLCAIYKKIILTVFAFFGVKAGVKKR
jgi:hypothetical protein